MTTTPKLTRDDNNPIFRKITSGKTSRSISIGGLGMQDMVIVKIQTYHDDSGNLWLRIRKME